MSILSKVRENPIIQEGIRGVFAGVEKVGKTSLICQAPGVLHIPLEIGYKPFPTKETEMLTTFDDVLALLDEIIALVMAGKNPYLSLGFDSATALEKLIHNKVIGADAGWTKGNQKGLTMESALGGYGKAYLYANELFNQFLLKCDWLAKYGGVNILFTCHVFPSRLINPLAGEYDTWDLLLHSPKNNKTYGKREMITQWADIVGFIYEPMIVIKNDNFAQGVNQNKGRVLGLERTPSYVAGNRYGLKGEISIPYIDSWNYLAYAIYEATNKRVDVFKR